MNDKANYLAKETAVLFDKNNLTETNFFDLVIFRVTIQHIPGPFLYILSANKALK